MDSVALYYDRKGKNISPGKWSKLFEDINYQRIISYQDKDIYISLVWLGLDHNFASNGLPLIFEILYENSEEGIEDNLYRFSSEEEALKAFKDIVDRVKNKSRFSRLAEEL